MHDDGQDAFDSLNAAETPNLVGERFGGRYEIVELIGHGGMGWVYRARHLAMGHAVAVKVMRPELAWNRRSLERFRREAQACSRLCHPHTIRVFDFGMEGRFPYLAMEYLAGESLSQRLRRVGALSPAQALGIAKQVAKSLDEAHAQGIVHRDLKPANIFLTPIRGEPDFVKVLDFGIAKFLDDADAGEALTQSGVPVGTPRYMAPEQLAGQPVDARADLYSLGVVLFQMLAGEPPFRARTTTALFAERVQCPNPRLTSRMVGPVVPLTLRAEALLQQILAVSPDDRPESAAALVRAIERIEEEERAVAAPVGPAGTPVLLPLPLQDADPQTMRGEDPRRRAAPRRRRYVALGGLAAVASVVFAWWLLRPAPHPEAGRTPPMAIAAPEAAAAAETELAPEPELRPPPAAAPDTSRTADADSRTAAERSAVPPEPAAATLPSTPPAVPPPLSAGGAESGVARGEADGPASRRTPRAPGASPAAPAVAAKAGDGAEREAKSPVAAKAATPRGRATVTITCNEAGATVYEAGSRAPLGTTPLKVSGFVGESKTYVVRSAADRSVQRRLTVRFGSQTSVQAYLPLPRGFDSPVWGR